MTWFEIRYYKSGYRLGLGPLFFRYNKQDDYTEISIGRITSSQYSLIGGMTYKEWKLHKSQVKSVREK